MKDRIQRAMNTWLDAQDDYAALINSDDWDSRYLRERGLIPNILGMLGECSGKTILDAGTGTGWLFEHLHLHPEEAHACDLVRPKGLPEYVEFRQDDVQTLSYHGEHFDAIVASLLLMFCPELGKVLNEFNRVCRHDASLIISLVHPYFYRTGVVTSQGLFVLEHDLSVKRMLQIRIGEAVGPLTYFYRPYPMYLNALVEAGWRIEETIDWFIDMEEYLDYRSLGKNSNVRRSGATPLYNFIRATKK